MHGGYCSQPVCVCVCECVCVCVNASVCMCACVFPLFLSNCDCYVGKHHRCLVQQETGVMKPVSRIIIISAGSKQPQHTESGCGSDAKFTLHIQFGEGDQFTVSFSF